MLPPPLALHPAPAAGHWHLPPLLSSLCLYLCPPTSCSTVALPAFPPPLTSTDLHFSSCSCHSAAILRLGSHRALPPPTFRTTSPRLGAEKRPDVEAERMKRLPFTPLSGAKVAGNLEELHGAGRSLVLWLHLPSGSQKGLQVWLLTWSCYILDRKVGPQPEPILETCQLEP